jgi:hypothetical protein
MSLEGEGRNREESESEVEEEGESNDLNTEQKLERALAKNKSLKKKMKRLLTRYTTFSYYSVDIWIQCH